MDSRKAKNRRKKPASVWNDQSADWVGASDHAELFINYCICFAIQRIYYEPKKKKKNTEHKRATNDNDFSKFLWFQALFFFVLENFRKKLHADDTPGLYHLSFSFWLKCVLWYHIKNLNNSIYDTFKGLTEWLLFTLMIQSHDAAKWMLRLKKLMGLFFVSSSKWKYISTVELWTFFFRLIYDTFLSIFPFTHKILWILWHWRLYRTGTLNVCILTLCAL